MHMPFFAFAINFITLGLLSISCHACDNFY